MKVYTAIGLMSGTSLDGAIDVALIRTDGHDYVEAVDFKPYPYDISVRDKVRACFGKRSRDRATDETELLVTHLHIEAVKALDARADVIGFHGQTITHDPDKRFTWQLGDGALLAKETGISVVSDLRQKDIQAGGQGAPLIPLYHKAIMTKQSKPVAVLNLGGVANVTYIGADGAITAFDTGPANALMDDFIFQRTGKPFDENGAMARKGKTSPAVLKEFMAHPYFHKASPKSLDRNQWSIDIVKHLSDEDGMATLLAMSVDSIEAGILALPGKPESVYVCGGGRKNFYMMDQLGKILQLPVLPVEKAGWDGDAIEAQGFAYLAVRSLLGLPLTLPATTGVPEAMSGGVLHKAA